MELLSSSAHLQRGGRNLTEGAKNRARSLTVARYTWIFDKKCTFVEFVFVYLKFYLYLCKINSLLQRLDC